MDFRKPIRFRILKNKDFILLFLEFSICQVVASRLDTVLSYLFHIVDGDFRDIWSNADSFFELGDSLGIILIDLSYK